MGVHKYTSWLCSWLVMVPGIVNSTPFTPDWERLVSGLAVPGAYYSGLIKAKLYVPIDLFNCHRWTTRSGTGGRLLSVSGPTVVPVMSLWTYFWQPCGNYILIAIVVLLFRCLDYTSGNFSGLIHYANLVDSVRAELCLVPSRIKLTCAYYRYILLWYCDLYVQWSVYVQGLGIWNRAQEDNSGYMTFWRGHGEVPLSSKN